MSNIPHYCYGHQFYALQWLHGCLKLKLPGQRFGLCPHSSLYRHETGKGAILGINGRFIDECMSLFALTCKENQIQPPLRHA